YVAHDGRESYTAPALHAPPQVHLLRAHVHDARRKERAHRGTRTHEVVSFRAAVAEGQHERRALEIHAMRFAPGERRGELGLQLARVLRSAHGGAHAHPPG